MGEEAHQGDSGDSEQARGGAEQAQQVCSLPPTLEHCASRRY